MVRERGRYGADGRCSTPRRSAATPSPTCTPGAQLQGQDIPLRVLAGRPGNELLVATLRRALETNRTAASIRESMALSLAWATIPQMAAAATPRPGERVRPRRVRRRPTGTLYLIAAGDEDSPVAPLLAAFVSGSRAEAGQLGSMTPAGKLDPPLWLGLDEVTQICPVPLPVMLADSAARACSSPPWRTAPASWPTGGASTA